MDEPAITYLFTRNPVNAVLTSDGNYWIPYDETADEIFSHDDPSLAAIEIAMEDTAGFKGAWQNEDWPY